MWTKLNLFWDFNPLNLDSTYQNVIDKLGVKLRLLNRKLFWGGTSSVFYRLDRKGAGLKGLINRLKLLINWEGGRCKRW